MVLYCIYRDIKSRPAEDTKVDEDKQLESTKEKSEEDRTSCISYDMEIQLKVWVEGRGMLYL